MGSLEYEASDTTTPETYYVETYYVDTQCASNHTTSQCVVVSLQVHEIVKGIFSKDPSRGVNPDEVVAMGAAIQVGCYNVTLL